MHTERLFRVHLYYWRALDFHEKDCVGITLVLGGLLKYLPLILDAVGLAVHIIVTAQSAVKSGCAEFVFFA